MVNLSVQVLEYNKSLWFNVAQNSHYHVVTRISMPEITETAREGVFKSILLLHLFA